ncbi:MAG: hypothetical protein ACKODZ_10465, partial [Verrucomicrobiota bacterium]
LKLVSVRKPIGIFTWHEDDIAKRLGTHGENALADVDRKTPRMRMAKLWFRLRHILEGGLIPPRKLRFELFTAGATAENRLVSFPRLGL